MSRTNTFMALYACDAEGCGTSKLALCVTLPEGCDPQRVGVPDGWVTYHERHFCSVPCFARDCRAALDALALGLAPLPTEGA